jgi:hypothetical protein
LSHLGEWNYPVDRNVKKFIDDGLGHDFVDVDDAFFDKKFFVVFKIVVFICFDLIAAVVNSTVKVKKEIIGISQVRLSFYYIRLRYGDGGKVEWNTHGY